MVTVVINSDITAMVTDGDSDITAMVTVVINSDITAMVTVVTVTSQRW